MILPVNGSGRVGSGMNWVVGGSVLNHDHPSDDRKASSSCPMNYEFVAYGMEFFHHVNDL